MQASEAVSRKRARALVAALAAALSSIWTVEAAYADPPPWTPAWGYPAKARNIEEKMPGQSQATYQVPFGIDTGHCNRTLVGTVLGGVGGSTIGDGNVASVAGGTASGFLVVGSIGRSMDQVDHNCVRQTLEHAPDGKSIGWDNPGTGARYRVIADQTYQDRGGRYCREYTTTSTIDGETWQIYGIACRQADGSWRLGG